MSGLTEALDGILRLINKCDDNTRGVIKAVNIIAKDYVETRAKVWRLEKRLSQLEDKLK